MKIKQKQATKLDPAKPKADTDDEQELEFDESKLAELVKGLLAKNGDSGQAAIERLMRENYKLREKLRRSNDRIKDLEEFELEEGGIVLTKVEAEEYNALKELGKPAEVKQRLDEHTTLKSKVAETEHFQIVERAAKVYNWNPVVLRSLLAQAKAGIGVRVIDNPNGDKTKLDQPYALVPDPADATKHTEVNLDDFAKSNETFKAFEASLLQGNGDGQDKPDQSFQQLPASRTQPPPKNTEAQAAHKSTMSNFQRFQKKE